MRFEGLIFAVALLAASSVASSAGATDVEVRVLNVGSAAGHVRVQVCVRRDWLKDCALSARGPARPGVSVVVVPDVPPGTYGVIAFHDANDNGDVDQNFLGIPTEGVGFSRGASIRLGAPRFDDAALQIEGARVVVPIRMQFEP